MLANRAGTAQAQPGSVLCQGLLVNLRCGMKAVGNQGSDFKVFLQCKSLNTG